MYGMTEQILSNENHENEEVEILLCAAAGTAMIEHAMYMVRVAVANHGNTRIWKEATQLQTHHRESQTAGRFSEPNFESEVLC
jgi:hypothetical protein